MRIRWLGWAGIEVESDGDSVVIDPLADASATFAPLGREGAAAQLPALVPAASSGCAVAGLLTHLHRDHADAGALAAALAEEACVFEPPQWGGERAENLGIAQADAELDAARLRRDRVGIWERREVGPFAVTALPAVDGLGDSQVAWLVEADGRRVLHLGDTIFHGYWWRMARRHGPFDLVLAPINGALISFPHLRPASPIAGTMEPEQAALAGELLGAAKVVPIHYDGYAAEGLYRPVANARERFLDACAQRSLQSRVLEVGAQLDLPA